MTIVSIKKWIYDDIVGITNNYDFVRSDLDGNITNSGKGSRGQIMKPPRQESTNVMFEQKTMNGQNKTMTTLWKFIWKLRYHFISLFTFNSDCKILIILTQVQILI